MAKAERLAAVVPTGNVVQAGSDAGEVANLAFFPKARTVAAGGAVEFKFSADSTEIHNVVFGPEPYLTALAETFFAPGPQGIALDAQSVYPSDRPRAPIGPFADEPRQRLRQHGDPGRRRCLAFPPSASVTFSTPGSYPFICTVHPFMQGTITVS